MAFWLGFKLKSWNLSIIDYKTNITGYNFGSTKLFYGNCNGQGQTF